MGPLAAFTVAGPALGAALLVATGAVWFEPLKSLGGWAAPVLLVATVVLCGLSLTPTHATSLVGGMLFGATWGSALALASTLAAAIFGYHALRPLALSRATAALASRPRATTVHRALFHGGTRRTALLIALIRLSPAMPFAATNLLMAAAGVRRSPFLFGTLLGIAPRVALVASAGAGLSTLDLTQTTDQRLLAAGAAATLLALLVASALARRALTEVTDH
ncbi:MAG: hypothetical protein GC161_16355 [Planctomycetaceae bacterium]|nr:hypothetical protein [Planctomycetaceae bacterium]